MFALVQDGSITKYFSGNQGITLGDIQYPKQIFTLWTKSEREAIGIYEVEFDTTNKKNEEYYINTNVSYAFGSGKVTGSYGSATARPHADTSTVRLEGLKTIKIRIIKQQAAGILRDTDWYIIRKADANTAIPSAITTHRAAVRTKCAEMETAITNAADTPALETLYTYTEQEDGSVTRPLGELPTLES